MILHTEGLTKYFGEVHAVDGVDLGVGEGEILSLIGPNGAGKTTLVNLISGFLSPDRGRIYFGGRDVTRHSPYEKIRDGIARSFQLVNLFDGLTALDNVRLPIFSRERRSGKMFSLAENDQASKEEALDVLELFALREKADVVAKGLAQGERKLLDVAVAFALRPRLILLDEPTSGVSTREKGHIMDTIVSVLGAKKMVAVIVEHDMDVVFKYSDRVVVMHEGRILADGRPSEIRENVEVQAKLLGGAA